MHYIHSQSYWSPTTKYMPKKKKEEPKNCQSEEQPRIIISFLTYQFLMNALFILRYQWHVINLQLVSRTTVICLCAKITYTKPKLNAILKMNS